MTKCYLLVSVILLSFPSCKPRQEDTIIRKWQEVKLENPQFDQALQDQEVFMDTVGTSTDSAANMKLYGVQDIDSMKRSLKISMDSFNRIQRRKIAGTWIDFRKDSVVYLHSDHGTDSASWYFGEDGTLTLDERKQKGVGGRIRQLEVATLSDTLLKLRFPENGMRVTATFKPAQK